MKIYSIFFISGEDSPRNVHELKQKLLVECRGDCSLHFASPLVRSSVVRLTGGWPGGLSRP